ncbi:MAG TPA: hypothetical protein VIM11_26195 [Tepidisphaeraceae bacterium]|jgi:type II secretory pathway component PulK
MWVTIIIGAVVLVFARSMRVELTAAANRVSTDQAEAVELGVEQYVLAQLDNIDGEADYVLNLPGEQCRIGEGYFWLLRPSANAQSYEFGITDEAGKFNLNYNKVSPTGALLPATDQTQLMYLPGMLSQQADSIIDWIDTDPMNITGGDGAESDYYQSLPEPYQAKNANLETIEELSLVQGVDSTLMYGIDRNHNGVIEQGETSQGSTGTNSNGVTADRGLFPFVTIYSAEPDTCIDGTPRYSCSGPPNPNTLKGIVTDSAVATAIQQAQSGGLKNVFQLVRPGLTSAQLAPWADKLSFRATTGSPNATTTGTPPLLKGLINVNTASREVLLTLMGVNPNLTSNDIDNLINERERSDTSTIMWVYDALQDKAASIGNYITNRSFVYSADIVAVSGDGRAFKRVRIVVDATQSPPKIVYRKDLTSMGWPLPESVRTSLRQGKGPGSSLTGNGGGGFGGMGGLGR